CSGWTFGSDCNSSCSCHTDNTESCDGLIGNCTCKSGFESTLCDVDINECLQNVSPCAENLQCYNTYGSYLCVENFVYSKLTLAQANLGNDTDNVVYTFQQMLQSWLDQYSWAGIKIIVSFYDIKHGLTSTDLSYNLITVYGSQSLDYYLMQIIYSHFIAQSRQLTVNGTDYEILAFKVYETFEEARLNINPKVYQMCQSNGICPFNSTCLNSEFLPICQVICDYGMYAEKEHCVACPSGKSTLVQGADSQHYCIENCQRGYRLTFDKLTCEPCPQDMYWSDADKTCHVCPYTSYNSTSCLEGEVRAVNNTLINIELNLTIVTPKCMNKDPQYFNNVNEKELVRLMISQNYYSRTYVPSSSQTNSHDQSSLEALMVALYDTSKLYQWIPIMNYQPIRLVQPFEIKITSIDDVSQQVLYVTNIWSRQNYWTDQLQVYNTIFQNIPEFISTYLLSSYSPSYDTTISYYEIWLRKNVDDLLIERMAKTMVLSHEKLGGNLTGPLLLYKTQQDRADGKMATTWKDVINSLSVGQYFCSGGNFILTDRGNGYFDCIEACGNWTWGENCTEQCNCTKGNTVVCEREKGSCICTSNFEGSSCEHLIDRCALYSPCDEHSDCINLLTHYECRCHEGYKHNPYNTNICQACSGWTFGSDCNSSCSCHTDNTESCDGLIGNCTCKSGFESTLCDVDINECLQNVSPCAENLQCYNTYGSYLCVENFVYSKLTLAQANLGNDTDNVVYTFQQMLQSWLDQYSWAGIKIIVSFYDIKHGLTSTDLSYNLITVYGSQSLDYYLMQIIYSHFIAQSRQLTVNGTDYEILAFKVYETFEEARLNINPKVYQMCQSNGICPFNSTCLNSEFLPICQVICDYGMYAEKEHCVACPSGKSTLVQGADSQHYCIENCQRGYRLTFDKLTCEPCPQDMYWSDADKTCHVCPYTSYNSTSCLEGEVRAVNNTLINIELNLTIVTPKCMNKDPQYFNNVNEKELVRLMISQNYYSRTYVPSSSQTNSHDQSSLEALMVALYDTSKLYQWIPIMNYQPIRLVQPFEIKITSIDDVSQQVLYVTNIWSRQNYWTDQLQVYNTIFQNIPEFISTYLLSSYSPSYDTTISYYEIWLRKNVDDLLIERMAKTMVLSHEKLGGNLTGPLLLYKTQQDRADGKMATTWKDVINSLSVGQYFCSGGNFILTDRGNGYFDCIEACGNWTWGENCTEQCNCTKGNTVVCEREKGSCICTSNFEGSSCEHLIDRCALYSPCDEHSDCINLLTHYECRCHEGYKHNPYNTNICQACSGWTFGSDCNSSCSCHTDNTESCDGLIGNCTCKSGFESTLCDVDINECLQNVSPCAENLQCYNTYGSYLCVENFVYSKLTLAQANLGNDTDNVVYTFQQMLQSWLDQYSWAGIKIIVSFYDIKHGLTSTDLSYNLITVYGSQSLDYYLMQIIYSHFIAQSRQLTVNGTDYEILAFKVYETFEEARLNINPKVYQMCQSNGICPFNSTCLNSEFLPICQVICDYGMYAEKEHCVACPSGKSTLVQGADSQHYCIENCQRGYRLTFDKLTCEPCPQDMYWSDADKTCHVCPYTSYNSTSCLEGEVRAVNNTLINIELNLTIVTPKCMNKDPQYFNNVNEKELVRLMISQNYYSRTYVPSSSQTNSHDQSSLEALMVALYDTSKLYQWIPIMNYQPIRLVQPFEIKITSIDDVSQQVLYVTNIWSRQNYWTDQLQVYNTIFQNIPEFISTYLLSSYSPSYDTTISYYEIWLRKNVDDLLIERMAKTMVLSHEKLGGNLTGPLLLYKTQQDRANGKMATTWKDVINSLSVGMYFCSGGNFILTDRGNGYFDCIEACGNWTWGENCTEQCNCTKGNTVVCEREKGSCICTSNFEGSSCEHLIDRCALYSPCDEHSDCINLLTHYECRCHEGYKHNPYNTNICEACSGWTFGSDCNSSCSCHTDNTESCDGLIGNCTCKSGFESTLCDVDINECLQNVSPCAENLQCYNTYGSYLCVENFVYSKLTLAQANLGNDTDNVVYTFQQMLQSWLDQYSWAGIKIIVSFYDIKHGLTSTDLSYNLITVYGSQSLDYYLMQIIYSHFIAQSRQLTVNGTDYEILAFKVYETFEEARLNINPKVYQMCQSNGICPFNSTCLNSEFLPICQVICDYGMYAEKEHCVACPSGKSTLVQGADSQHYCIENCQRGYRLTFDKLTCEPCPQDMYWSDADKTCHVCPYTSYNSTSCLEGEVRAVNNTLINIELNLTIVTPKCMNKDPQYFNNVNEKELVRLMISQNYYSRTYVPSSSQTNSHDQSSLEALMVALYDTSKLYQWIPIMNYQPIRLLQPFEIKITSIDDVSQQVLYVTNIWSRQNYWTDQLQVYNTIFQNIPEFISTYLLSSYSPSYDTTISYYEIWLRKNVDDLLIERMAKTMVLSHEKLGGNLTGPLLLYKTQQDRADGKMATTWKDVINSLSVGQYFCSGGNFILTDRGNGYFDCIEGTCICKDGFNSDTCGTDINECLEKPCGENMKCLNTFGSFQCQECELWTWGDDCKQICECNHNKTQSCSSGTCFCLPNYTGASCDQVVDMCLEYSPCSNNSFCVSTDVNSYVCRCDNGYKSSALSTNRPTCEDCGNWTWGYECSQNCQCNIDNTVSCDKATGYCYCKSGFQSIFCDQDINECEVAQDLCASDKYCLNTYGNYTCIDINELYPYGPIAGDTVVDKTEGSKIHFTPGIPFGHERSKFAYVMPNGAILFNKERVWYPHFEYTLSLLPTTNVLAPFWFDQNPYQPGQIFYHLYEKGSSKYNENITLSNEIFNRAIAEVKERYNLTSFLAMSVLVATWENVEPEYWYTWYCQNWNNYYNSYYFIYYNWWNILQNCYQKPGETNTFQAVLVSDGQSSFAVINYKIGAMKWKLDYGRRIAVGFVYSETIKDYGVTYTDITTKMDTTIWNTGSYGKWIEQIGFQENPDSKCLNFYLANYHLIGDFVHQERIRALFQCPCSLDQGIGAQWSEYNWLEELTTDEEENIFCLMVSPLAKARLERFSGNPYNELCCYRRYNEYSEYIYYRAPNAGYILFNDPWVNNGRNHKLEDYNPHKWCCQESSSPSYYCTLFNAVKPSPRCTLNPEIISGRALGDPHIQTLDGHMYTFNGLGEYILLSLPEQDYMLQARTKQVLTSQGNRSLATVFVAFAAVEGNYSKFQVELDYAETGMVIVANNQDVTQDFYIARNFSQILGNNAISLHRDDRSNRTTLIATFPSGISLKFFVGFKNLEFAVDVSVSYKGKLRGLLGNFNDDPNDDFILPDGTVLTGDKISTELNLFENFGKEWQVTSTNTIFSYLPGESALDYQHPDFKPLFKEEIDSTSLARARSKCNDNDACIYDYVLTESEQFALNSKIASQEAEALKIIQRNILPVITFNTSQLNSKQQWELTHGRTSVLTFKATDTDVEDNITYHLTGTLHRSVTLNSNSGILTYTPNASLPLTIGVKATDSKGGSSSVIYLDLVVCTSCNNFGTCDWKATRQIERENGRFLLGLCQCFPAYTGEDCESELDACKPNPCLPGQTCIDKAAVEQGNSTLGYTCESCPDGFLDMNGTCIDINECFTNETCPKNSECANSIGSYQCTCLPGYRLDLGNTSRCQDIDECIEGTNNCQQICENNDGNYTCACLPGNLLTTDKSTCQLDSSSFELCTHKGCSQTCTVTNGTAVCGCFIGYTLDNDTQHCIDLNECTLANSPCSHSCANTNGSFQCSCYPGYKLSNDGTTCTVCPKPYYGSNCLSMCICNGHGTCDSVKGCKCSEGWKGDNCNQDVNECDENEACPLGQICVNTLGSFQCKCPLGYEYVSNQCQDINECLDVLDNTCNFSTQDCVNNQGSYTCECSSGYARNVNNVCTDIDECAAKTHNCEQICENTPGKYNCKCNYGYKLSLNRTACIKNLDVCSGSSLNCSDICSVNLITNTPYCLCKTGYILQGNNTCIDIDECQYEQLNLCSQKDSCLNTEGGYSCSCQSGYYMDNNGRTCIACAEGKWGLECSNDCACSTGADRCDPQKGCICKPGFTGVHCDKDLDECSNGLLTCGVREHCVNTFGNASCQCLDGYTSVGGLCQDVNECAKRERNNCSQDCRNYEGGFSCSCFPGFKFDPLNKTCTDVDECQIGLHNCKQLCQNTDGSYRCSCLDGWKLTIDRVSCIEATKCLNKTCSDICATVDGVDTCFCPKGKELDPKNKTQCIDVDMCKGNPCTDGCVETEEGTGFMCTCPIGKLLAADSITCTDCLEGRFGSNCSSHCTCDSTNTITCDKVNGSCICKTGWTTASCQVDINECILNPSCPLHYHCVNTLGSYICKCDVGYYSTTTQCEACSPGTYGEECKNQCQCDMTHSTCDPATGQCTCHQGWTGSLCDTDINECESSVCAETSTAHWICLNTPGSFKCTCAIGYANKNNTCEDINECTLAINDCQQVCQNKVGSYACLCNSGYYLNQTDKRTCYDINECSSGSTTCQQVCNNVDGDFFCSCQVGYQLNDTDKRTCYKAKEFQFQLKIMYNADGKNLKEKMSKYYIELKYLIETILKETISASLKSLAKISVLNLRPGSLIVDFLLILMDTNETSVVGKMIESFVQIEKSGLMLNGSKLEAFITVGNMTVTPAADKCYILGLIEQCSSDEFCQIDSGGIANCKNVAEIEGKTSLILGLTMGLTLGMALFISLACCIRYRRRFSKLKRDDANSSERSFNIHHQGFLSYQDMYSSAPPATRVNLRNDREKLFP
ncbi:fibrillin-3, partial [Biomphalaria pfeifferi]